MKNPEQLSPLRGSSGRLSSRPVSKATTKQYDERPSSVTHFRFALIPLLFSTALACFVSSTSFAGEACESLIKKGDVHYARLQPTEALKYYLPAEQLEPNNVPLLVRIARQYRHLHSECSRKEEA